MCVCKTHNTHLLLYFLIEWVQLSTELKQDSLIHVNEMLFMEPRKTS